jgi:hypothetical protein
MIYYRISELDHETTSKGGKWQVDVRIRRDV